MNLQVRVDRLDISNYGEQIGGGIVNVEAVERSISRDVVEAVRYTIPLDSAWEAWLTQGLVLTAGREVGGAERYAQVRQARSSSGTIGGCTPASQPVTIVFTKIGCYVRLNRVFRIEL